MFWFGNRLCVLLNCRDHDDHSCQKPEGFHDADDDKRVGADSVDKHGDESGQIAQSQTVEEGIGRGCSIYMEGVHVNSVNQDEKGDHPCEPRFGENARILSIDEAIARNPVTKNGLFDKIFFKDIFPGRKSGRGGCIDPHIADGDLSHFLGLSERE